MNPGARKTSSLVLMSLVVVVFGVLTAWFISQRLFGSSAVSGNLSPGVKVTDTEAGALDSNVKYDSTIGVLVEGGIGNEGTHHLERDGGPSKSVYLTSSVIDLQSFVGKKVEVWGQTLASKKAGWMMDVAKVKISND